MQPADKQDVVELSGRFCVSSAYLAPLEYYRLLSHASEVWIEQYEFFQRQTYRNRCHIAASGGLTALTIPVEKSSSGKELIRDIRISEHGQWQQQHWRTISAAYSSSPFFEYYADDLSPFYEKKYDFLWDYNFELQQTMCDLLDIKPNIRFTEHYYQGDDPGIYDLRDVIHPKKSSMISEFKPYYQVFAERNGFIPNLSILDLLMNMGNESIFVL
jgi:hypothetical protein